MKNMKNIVAAFLLVATFSVSTVFAGDGIIVGNRDGIIVGNAADTNPCAGRDGIIVGNRDGIIVGNVATVLTGIIVGNFAGGIIVGNAAETPSGTCRNGFLISD